MIRNGGLAILWSLFRKCVAKGAQLVSHPLASSLFRPTSQFICSRTAQPTNQGRCIICPHDVRAKCQRALRLPGAPAELTALNRRRYTSFTFLSGRLRTGLPVAAKIAFITAGVTTQIVGSPTPPQKS